MGDRKKKKLNLKKEEAKNSLMCFFDNLPSPFTKEKGYRLMNWFCKKKNSKQPLRREDSYSQIALVPSVSLHFPWKTQTPVCSQCWY